MPHVTDDETALPAKRGRGRPRKPDALTNAQRQAAWRARQRGANKSVTVTENPLSAECERLRRELARARQELKAQSATPPSPGPSRVPSSDAPAQVAAVLARCPRRADPDAGERSLRLTVGNPAFFALERLVSHFGLSRRAVIERMLSWADDAVSQSFQQDDAAFNRYVDRRNRNE